MVFIKFEIFLLEQGIHKFTALQNTFWKIKLFLRFVKLPFQFEKSGFLKGAKL